jgi:hypothetical protein
MRKAAIDLDYTRLVVKLPEAKAKVVAQEQELTIQLIFQISCPRKK